MKSNIITPSVCFILVLLLVSTNAHSVTVFEEFDSIDSCLYRFQKISEPSYTYSITGGELRISKPAGGNPTFTVGQIASRYFLHGDFNVEVKYRLVTSANNSQFQLNIYTAAGGWITGMRRNMVPTAPGDYSTWWASTCGLVATTDLSGYMRYERVGSTWTSYRKSPGGAWIQNCSQSGTTGPIYFALSAQNNGGGTPAVDVGYDSLFVIADSIEYPDGDLDGVYDLCDNCPNIDNVAQLDADGDGFGDACDLCEGYDDAVDSDLDGVPDQCDMCHGWDDAIDDDGDTVPDVCDICPGFDDLADADNDKIPDSCDICPDGNDNLDSDSDGVPNDCDNCFTLANPGQEDDNENGIGDACESDCRVLIYSQDFLYVFKIPANSGSDTSFAQRFSLSEPETLKTIDVFIYDFNQGHFGDNDIYLTCYEDNGSGLPGALIVSDTITAGNYPAYPGLSTFDFSSYNLVFENDFHLAFSTNGVSPTSYEDLLSADSLPSEVRSSICRDGVWSELGEIYGINVNFMIMPTLCAEQTCCSLPGDFDDNGEINISDLTSHVGWLFKGGAAPSCLSNVEVDGNCQINISDLTYRVAYQFKNGPDLVCGCAEGANTSPSPSTSTTKSIIDTNIKIKKPTQFIR